LAVEQETQLHTEKMPEVSWKSIMSLFLITFSGHLPLETDGEDNNFNMDDAAVQAFALIEAEELQDAVALKDSKPLCVVPETENLSFIVL
jgi:hypothetical protein